ncbi:hypothetical protein Ahy_A03g011313 [Arachis hypogaea]|uniref:Aminotransferase-like plant mobile domain-containing protein n=1 Tax=Arachis hypogaea TaxID=3818 RepID=A0A445DQC3_ARAHY|nr:hypothetical protein Ahy_A03g011313 [Arachis hypogaea]
MGLATISYMSDEMDPKLTGESLTTISIIPPAKWRTAHHWRQQRNGDIKGGACKMEHPASGIHELGHICCSAHKMTKPMAAATKWCRFVVNAASFRLLQSSTNMHWPARVLTPHGTLVDVFTSEPPDPSMDIYYRLSFWAPEVATLYSFPLATRWAGKKGHNNYAEQCLLRHRLRLDNLQVDEFNWLPYMEPRILSRVPAEFLGAPHRDFYTSVVPLILFWWIEILNIDRVLRQFGGKQGLLNPPLVARTPVNLV